MQQFRDRACLIGVTIRIERSTSIFEPESSRTRAVLRAASWKNRDFADQRPRSRCRDPSATCKSHFPFYGGQLPLQSLSIRYCHIRSDRQEIEVSTTLQRPLSFDLAPYPPTSPPDRQRSRSLERAVIFCSSNALDLACKAIMNVSAMMFPQFI
jgi:hypothetical protein